MSIARAIWGWSAKNYGLQFASNNWILCLDADERLTPQLIETINKLDLNSALNDAYSMPRRNYIGSRWIVSGAVGILITVSVYLIKKKLSLNL